MLGASGVLVALGSGAVLATGDASGRAGVGSPPTASGALAYFPSCVSA